MQSTGKTIAVIGSRGSLAPFVIAKLGDAGYRVVTDDIKPHGPGSWYTDLTRRAEASWLVNQWKGRLDHAPIDGLVALTGDYENVGLNDTEAFGVTLLNNVMPVVNMVAILLQDLQQARGPVIAVDTVHVFDAAPPKEGAYRAGKAALAAYMHGLKTDAPSLNVQFIEPYAALNSDANRLSMAKRILVDVKRSFGA